MPNRIVGSVINYPRGYVRCLVDVTLPADPEKRVAMEKVVERLMGDYAEQYPGIMQAPPSVEGIQTTNSGKVFMHVKFRIRPGRVSRWRRCSARSW